MSNVPRSLFRARLCVTGAVSVFVWALLAWAHFNGGVPSHHLLNDPSLPAVSNWWGGLLLPALAWFLTGIVNRRIARAGATRYPAEVVAAFGGALAFGALLSVMFLFGPDAAPGYMARGLFVLALLLPIYRAEYVLGFVVGMTATFGVLLPTAFAAVVALVVAALYLVVRPGFLRAARWLSGRDRAARDNHRGSQSVIGDNRSVRRHR